MAMRCKMQVSQITEHANSVGKTVRFEARYDQVIPDDQRFMAATPSGHVEMFVTNAGALDQLTLGTAFYVDFVPVEAVAQG